MADTTATLLCRFTPLDTWFFRESRPHGSVGASELGSIFPPPVRTLAGALRTYMGDARFAQNGSSWQEFARDVHHPLRAIIGFGDDLGALRITGAFLNYRNQRLFPAPANLTYKKNGAGAKTYSLLRLGAESVQCDLGNIRLPDDSAGGKPVEGAWLTEEGWRSVLAGSAPAASHVIEGKALLDEEPRLGLGRDASRRAVVDGLLYQTRHLRLREGVAVELLLDGLDAAAAALLPEKSIVRLGGEGRAAALTVQPLSQPPALPGAGSTIPAGEAVLYTLSPTPCTGELPAGIPEGFERIQQADGTHVWRGTLRGCTLSILCAVCQRPVREGGWDLARHRAQPVRSLLPAGSALYVHCQTPLPADALHALADAWGRGLITAGKMP